jgi:hypothetical protein
LPLAWNTAGIPQSRDSKHEHETDAISPIGKDGAQDWRGMTVCFKPQLKTGSMKFLLISERPIRI